MNLPVPTPGQLTNAAANVFDQVFRGGLADLRRTPAAIIHEAPQCTVYRYLVPDESACRELPVLLVPPLAAPTLCFDLRRGCSLAEHLLALGHPTYLVEYGEIGFSDRELGLEHWVDDVLATAIRRVSEENGGGPAPPPRRRARPARRVVPGRDHVAARRRRTRRSARQCDRHGRQPVRLHARAPDGT